MPQDRQPYERKHRLPALLLAVVLSLPALALAEAVSPPWLVAGALGLYTLLFLLLFYRLPRWIAGRRGPDVARRWQYAALLAGLATMGVTVATTVQKFPIEPHGLRLGLATLAAVFSYTWLGWLLARHFPEACPWGRR